jgi:hypothetical protein
LAGDEANAIATDERILLVRPDLKETEAYWALFSARQRKNVSTFRKRPIWNHPDDGKIPAAFFFSLVHNGPRLIANTAGINSNNSVYRVYFKVKMSEDDVRGLALLMMSSYSQVQGELIGRVCGGGGLKFEPSDAAKLTVPLVPPGFDVVFPDLWRRVDLLVRNGEELQAIEQVDAAIQTCWNMAISTETLITVQRALQKLRNARWMNGAAEAT